MRKVIAAINMSLDGIFDHDKMNPGEEVHDYFSKLLDDAGILLYGRITYGLMRFWQTLLENPSGERSMDDFAKAIDRVDKLVFSSTLHDTGWSTAQIAQKPLAEDLLSLKQQPGKDIYLGSGSMIKQAIDHHLLDELHICIHPVIAGNGRFLFEEINEKHELKLIGTRTFSEGAVVLSYRL